MNAFKSMMAGMLVSVFSLSTLSYASSEADIQSICDEEFGYSGLQPEEKNEFMENCSVQYGFNATYEEDDYIETEDEYLETENYNEPINESPPNEQEY